MYILNGKTEVNEVREGEGRKEERKKEKKKEEFDLFVNV